MVNYMYIKYSVQFSHSVMSDSLRPHGLQHARPHCPSPTPGVYSNSWPLEKAMAPHSSTLAWKIPWTEEPGRLQSMGSLRVGNDWAASLSLFTFMHWRRKWQPTSVFLPGESQGQRSLSGQPSMGSHRVGHDWSDLAAAAAAACPLSWWCHPNISSSVVPLDKSNICIYLWNHLMVDMNHKVTNSQAYLEFFLSL